MKTRPENNQARQDVRLAEMMERRSKVNRNINSPKPARPPKTN